MDFPMSYQSYSLYDLFFMLVLVQDILLLQFALWDHFAPTISKISFNYFLRHFTNKLSMSLFMPFIFKLILAIFLEVFFFIRFSVLTIPTFFTSLRSISFDPHACKLKLFPSNLKRISMLIKSLSLPLCHSLDEGRHTSSKFFSSFCPFISTHLPSNQ